MNEPLKAELHSLFSFDIYPVASSEQNTGVKLVLTSSPTFALRDSGGGFPLVGDG